MLKFRAVLVLFFTLMLNNSYAESWLNNEVFQQNVEFARGEVNAIADGGRENFAFSVAEAVSQAHPNADRVAAIIYFATKMYPSLASDIVSAAVAGSKDSAATIVYVASSVAPNAAPEIITAALTVAPEKALTATHAAVSAAPNQTLNIVTAAVTTAPKHAGKITYAAIFANPPMDTQIVATAKAAAPDELTNSIDQALASARADLNGNGQYAFKESYKRYDFDNYLREKGEQPAKVAEGEKQENDDSNLDDKPGEDAYFEHGTLENRGYGNNTPSGNGNGSSSAASPS